MKAGTSCGLGTTSAVVRDEHDQASVGSTTLIDAPVAPAYLATFASASEHTKYAAASCGAGKRRVGTVHGDRDGRMVGQITERLGEPVLGERPGVHALREAGQVLGCRIELVDEREEGEGCGALVVARLTS